MKLKLFLGLACVFFFTLMSASGAAFIKFDGVDGESTDADHDKWINILTVNQSHHQPGGGATGATRRRGDVVYDDIVVTGEMDKASPKIAEKLARGEVIPLVDIHVTKIAGGAPVVFLAYQLKNVQVTSYSLKVGADVQNTFSLNFEEIKVTYTDYDEAGGKRGNVEYEHRIELGE